MQISGFTVQPTCEIHLLLDPPEPMEVTLQAWGTIVPIMGIAQDGFSAAVATASVAGTKVIFAPVGLGSTIGRVKFTDHTENPKVTHEVLVRVSVHQKIDAFWIGNTRATVARDENNYVLTVYAKFSDGTIGDVTGHPYLTFSSPNTAKVAVDTRGRLKGEAKTTTPVQVSVAHANSQGTQTHTVPCEVSEPLATLRPKLKRIHGAGPFGERRNILFLPEGFTAGEEAEFDALAKKMVSSLFDTAEHSPFNLLKHRFNVWTAFEASPESGISIGPPVQADGTPVPQRRRDSSPCGGAYPLNKLVSLVGLPQGVVPASLEDAVAAWTAAGVAFDAARVDQQLFDAWSVQKPIGRVQARDSFFGLMLGGVLGARSSTTSPLPDNQWFVPEAPARGLEWAARRVPPELDGAKVFDRYLASLRHGSGPADPNFMVSDAWKPGAPDAELVCFLVREDLRGGVNFGRLAMTVGEAKRHTITVAGDVIHHAPSVTAVEVDVASVTGVLAHEAAHSFSLGDEYEGYDDPAHTMLAETDKDGRKRVQKYDNLTHHYNVKHASSDQLDVSMVKWDWHRVEKASTLKGAATMTPEGIQVELRPREGAAWEAARAAGRAVHLRHRELNTEIPSSPARTSVPLTITNIAGDVLTLAGTVGAGHYPAGSVLLLPRVKSGNVELRMMDQNVFAHLVSTAEPFGKKNGQCAVCSDRVSFPDPNIPGLTYPRFRYQLVGVYEGGGTYNCRVYRSVGVCRMRQSRPFIEVLGTYVNTPGLYDPGFEPTRNHEFGFVAKYLLVNRLDPEQLGLLDAEYPR